MKLSTKISRVNLKFKIIDAACEYAHRFARNPSTDIDDNYNSLSKRLNELLKINWEKN